MWNAFIVKKWVALLMAGFLPLLGFAISSIYYPFIWAVAISIGAMLIGCLLGILFLSNPFTNMLEGKGLIVFNLDSTGVISPFLVQVKSPYIQGKFKGRMVKDVFDRSSIFQLSTPKFNSTKAELTRDDKGNNLIKIELKEKQYNENRFAFFHYPALLWNDQLKSFITKDDLSGKEKDTFAEHGVLYLNRKLEELTGVVRDFARYIVELTKPNQGFGGKWFWIILIIGLCILAAIFAPSIIKAIQQGMGSGAGSTISNVLNSGQTITPKP